MKSISALRYPMLCALRCSWSFFSSGPFQFVLPALLPQARNLAEQKARELEGKQAAVLEEMEQLKQRVLMLQDEVGKAQRAAQQAQETVELHQATEALSASEWQEKLQKDKESWAEQGLDATSQRLGPEKKTGSSKTGSWEVASWNSWTKPTASAMAALGALESRTEAGSVASSQQSKRDKVGIARARLLHCASLPQVNISQPSKAALSIYDCLILLWDFDQNRPDRILAERKAAPGKVTALKRVVSRRRVAFYAAAMQCAVSLTQPSVVNTDGQPLRVGSDRVKLEKPGDLAAFVQSMLRNCHKELTKDRSEGQTQEKAEEQDEELEEANALLRPKVG